MSHSANIYKENLKTSQNDNGDHPINTLKIEDLKGDQMGHGRHKSGPNSDEPENSCSVEPIVNPGVSSKQSDANSLKQGIVNNHDPINPIQEHNKENQSLNCSVVDEPEMPASRDLAPELKTPPKPLSREKMINLILKQFSKNLENFKNHHK